MAVVLTTSYQQIGGTVKFYDESSYYYYMYAKYSKVGATRAQISVCFRTFGTGSEKASCSGATMNYSLTGIVGTKTAGSGSFSVNRRAYSGDIGTYTFTVDYDSQTGKYENKTLTGWVTGGSGSYSGGGSLGTCASEGSISGTISLPPIDPSPTIVSRNLAIQSNGFHSLAVASITTLRFTASVTYAKSATLTVTGAGITNTYSLSVTGASSETITKDFVVNPSTDNYQINATLSISNDTGNVSGASTFNVRGYHLPTYGSATYTARCLQDGTADSQGEYGRLYLTWSIAPVDTSNPNTLQTCTVKLNGTQITATSGSISQGYLDFIFPLPVNVQGNLNVYFADEIYNNTITSLVVPKSIMPLSLYQSGDSVGVSVGRMATSDGFWCYEEFYLKQSGGTKVFNVAIDGSGNMTITDVSGTLSMNYVPGDTI